MPSMRACVLLVALPVLVLISPAHAADATLADPVAYCQAVANADARYTGPRVPDWMIAALYKDGLKAQKKAKLDPARAVVWRCMGRKIFACVQGNSPIYGKANQEMKPSAAMRAFCTG
jgi:hypothetical protein